LRILLFYVGSVLVILAVVPWPEIAPGSSPFALALERMAIPFAATTMNLIVLVAVLSCLNSGLYVTSRMLFGLAAHAPRWLVGETVRWQVTLRPVPSCGLVGTARSEAEQHEVRVDLDKDGQWLLWAPAAPERLSWAMYGWEFAVGLASGSRPARIRGQRDSP
jgi:amino acid transporter